MCVGSNFMKLQLHSHASDDAWTLEEFHYHHKFWDVMICLYGGMFMDSTTVDHQSRGLEVPGIMDLDRMSGLITAEAHQEI